MLTWGEISITLIALLGVGYDAHVFAVERGTKGWSTVRLILYAALVVMPKLLVILYAFLKFAAD